MADRISLIALDLQVVSAENVPFCWLVKAVLGSIGGTQYFSVSVLRLKKTFEGYNDLEER